MGPLRGGGARAIALTEPEQFLRNARLATGEGESRNPALAHILRVERDVVVSAERLHAGTRVRHGAFRRARSATPIGTAAQLAANRAGISVVRISLGGFDTHANQRACTANLLRQLGEGSRRCARRWSRSALGLDRDRDLSEFGRRPRENQSGGTDHGTAAAHFRPGRQGEGGSYGAAPRARPPRRQRQPAVRRGLPQLLRHLPRPWWGMDARRVVGSGFRPSTSFK
jgi:uncharacterized protein (DUF1501 family)